MIFTDENLSCTIDLSSAITAVGDLNVKYSDAGLAYHFSDVDWIIETDESVILVEYKNTDVENARNPDAFNEQIKNGALVSALRKKYFGGAFYVLACQKHKPLDYICVIEAEKLDSVLRKRLCGKLMKGLPSKLQELPEITATLINKVKVLSIEQWNTEYPMFPMTRT